MSTKCCWAIHGSLTSERKASTCPSSFINHSILLLNRALKRQAPCFYMHFEVRALDRLRMRRRVESTRRRGNHMHDHSRFQRDFNDVTGVSLSLSLPLTKVTDAQYRKRFRASYNNVLNLPRTMIFSSWLSSITLFEGPSFLGLLTSCISPIEQCALVV